MFYHLRSLLLLGALAALMACTSAPAATPTSTPDAEFVFGLILVGPEDDHGWSEAHYNGGRYVEKHLANSRMVFLSGLNPSDRPEATVAQVVADMVAEGARLIFVTSDDFAADTRVVAQQYPDVIFMHISGDHVLSGNAPPNLGNLMGQIEYGKMIAGCTAALATETGSIAYLGALINNETRRLANATYLGARYCYEHFRGRNPDDLRYQIEWVGFWFHIPGVTADPMLLAHEMFDSGADIILSGIDTTEALIATNERAASGEKVWVIPYDYEGACDIAPEVCLGVPYFNWGPDYLYLAREVQAATWQQSWNWTAPDWRNINDHDSSSIGFLNGPALTSAQATQLDQFIAGLADGTISLFQGPLHYQDGSLFLDNGESASDEQIWYMTQLLAGMEGDSD